MLRAPMHYLQMVLWHNDTELDQ